MAKEKLLKIPPQKDVLTLKEGKDRTGRWKKFMNTTIYQGKDTDLPHGIFFPFMDIVELVKLAKKVKKVEVERRGTTEKRKIHIVGVRAYYSFTADILDPIGVGQKEPISAHDYPVEAVMVLVYQFANKKSGRKKDFFYNQHQPTHDLIVRVPSQADKDFAGSAGAYSIYDITRPCPPLCDPKSQLF